MDTRTELAKQIGLLLILSVEQGVALELQKNEIARLNDLLPKDKEVKSANRQK